MLTSKRGDGRSPRPSTKLYERMHKKKKSQQIEDKEPERGHKLKRQHIGMIVPEQ